jgi:hypothetical protein
MAFMCAIETRLKQVTSLLPIDMWWAQFWCYDFANCSFPIQIIVRVHKTHLFGRFYCVLIHLYSNIIFLFRKNNFFHFVFSFFYYLSNAVTARGFSYRFLFSFFLVKTKKWIFCTSLKTMLMDVLWKQTRP